MNNFTWGHVVSTFTLELDTATVEVIKYQPWLTVGDTPARHTRHKAGDKVLFHCKSLHESFHSLDALLITWIAHKNLGCNQHTLVSGICRALNVV